MSTGSEQEFSGDDVAEPFRFNFEIAWEVANKGKHTVRWRKLSLTSEPDL